AVSAGTAHTVHVGPGGGAANTGRGHASPAPSTWNTCGGGDGARAVGPTLNGRPPHVASTLTPSIWADMWLREAPMMNTSSGVAPGIAWGHEPASRLCVFPSRRGSCPIANDCATLTSPEQSAAVSVAAPRW